MSLKTWAVFRWICTPLWSLDGPELPESAFSLDTIRYSSFYFFNTSYFNFIHQIVNLDSFSNQADCSFLIISKFDLYIRNGILRGQKCQVIVVQAYLEIPTRLPRELQLWILESGTDMTFSYHCRTLTPKIFWFSSLPWIEVLHHDFHGQVFSQRCVSSGKIFVVCSIYHSCASSTELIAMRRRLLLSTFLFTFVSKEALIVFILARFSSSFSAYAILIFFLFQKDFLWLLFPEYLQLKFFVAQKKICASWKKLCSILFLASEFFYFLFNFPNSIIW